jgi:formylmethanofuran dehydrogenase subunit C
MHIELNKGKVKVKGNLSGILPGTKQTDVRVNMNVDLNNIKEAEVSIDTSPKPELKIIFEESRRKRLEKYKS